MSYYIRQGRDVVHLHVFHRGVHHAVALVEVVDPVTAVGAAVAPALDPLAVAHVGAGDDRVLLSLSL